MAYMCPTAVMREIEREQRRVRWEANTLGQAATRRKLQHVNTKLEKS